MGPSTPARRGGAIFWTDGSCQEQADPLLARAAWAVATEEGQVIAGPVGGSQTAQRAEVAALVAAWLMSAQGLVEVVTDSRYVTDYGHQLALSAEHPGPHGDLWSVVHSRSRRGR